MAYFGIYSAMAMNTADPKMNGRIQVSIPILAGPTSAWAMPCREFKSTSLPPVGTAMWVMFEQGNLDHPVWMGCAN